MSIRWSCVMLGVVGATKAVDEADTDEKFNQVRDGFEATLKEFKESLKGFTAALASGMRAKKKVDAEMSKRLKTATKTKGVVATSAPKTLDKLFDKMYEALKFSDGKMTNVTEITKSDNLDGKACKALLVHLTCVGQYTHVHTTHIQRHTYTYVPTDINAHIDIYA